MIRAVLILALLAASPAQAHKLKLFAAHDGQALVGTAYFTGGAKAQGAQGVVQGKDGAELGRFVTDAEGGFRLPLAAGLDYSVTIDAGDGHVASTRLAPDEVAPAAGSPDHALIEAAVARQILPLRRQLDEYEDRVRLHDILGGLGAILGLFGGLAWMQSRRRP
jgi:nickel transport protein